MTDGQIPTLRAKRPSLSDYVKEIKQRFSHWYNKRHGRKGFFWGERFKSMLVENGDTLVNCLAYIRVVFVWLSPGSTIILVAPQSGRDARAPSKEGA